jgi:ABC-type polysaccharide/polyol phosphate transport system ATPase subunit
VSEAGPVAVRVENVGKRYRIYHERNQSLKSIVMRGGRASFDEFWALDDVTFDIPAGTTFGLIGENGSGKSTLLKCIAKILRPDRGTITTDGKVAALLELGSGFHPELSGRENVYLNASILGLSRKEVEGKFDDIVGFAGLERFIDNPVKNYSSGMYVRLGFSVAINVDPDVLLVDEVLAVGDESFQRRCAEKFYDFRKAGKTVVVVSHAMGQLRNLCDQVAWLEHGKVRAVGAPGNVVDDYVEASHVDHDEADRDTPAEKNRWGSGEARIERVELLDGSGSGVQRLHTGEPLTVRVHWRSDQGVQKPVFGLAVHTLEGVEVTGPNTRDADVVFDELTGSGVVDFVVDRLLLLPGAYELTAALYDWTRQHPFDHRHRFLRFDVEPGEPREGHGFVSLGGRWQAR